MPNRPLKTIDWYNTHAAHYAVQADKYAPLAQMNDFGRYLSKGARVLDVGCGSGRDSNLLSHRGYEVTGIDLSSKLLAIGKKRFPQIRFANENLLHTSIENESFDGIWSHASLVHLESMEELRLAFSEFWRILKPNGVLHVFVKANTDSRDSKIILDNRTGDERFFRYYTQEQLKSAAANSDFSIIKLYQFEDPHSPEKYNKRVEWITLLGQKRT